MQMSNPGCSRVCIERGLREERKISSAAAVPTAECLVRSSLPSSLDPSPLLKKGDHPLRTKGDWLCASYGMTNNGGANEQLSLALALRSDRPGVPSMASMGTAAKGYHCAWLYWQIEMSEDRWPGTLRCREAAVPGLVMMAS